MDILPIVVTHNDLPSPSLMLHSEMAILPLVNTVPSDDLPNNGRGGSPTLEAHGPSRVETYTNISRAPGSGAASQLPLLGVNASTAALGDTTSSIHPTTTSEPPLSPTRLEIPSVSSTNVADRSVGEHGDLPPLQSASHSSAGAEAATETGRPPNASQDIFGLSLDFFVSTISCLSTVNLGLTTADRVIPSPSAMSVLHHRQTGLQISFAVPARPRPTGRRC